jgi:hypothetical protein
VSHSTEDSLLKLALYAGLLTWVGLAVWWRSLRRARLVEDLGTSTVRGMAQGYVELVGRQYPVDGQALLAPLTGTPCTWWHYRIEEHKRSFAYRGGARWVLLEEARSDLPIEFRDATGSVLVDPCGAELMSSISTQWYGDELDRSRPVRMRHARNGRYRYVERRMGVGARMYVAAQWHRPSAREVDDTARAVADLLGRWKLDQPALLRRFDRDGNGRIDMDEWECARQAAGCEVAAGQREVRPSRPMLRKPDDGAPFLIADTSQQEVVDRKRVGVYGGLLMLAFGLAGLAYAVHGWLAIR